MVGEVFTDFFFSLIGLVLKNMIILVNNKKKNLYCIDTCSAHGDARLKEKKKKLISVLYIKQ